MPLSTESTLLCCPDEEEGPFPRVLQMVRGWVRTPPAAGVKGQWEKDIFPPSMLPRGRLEGSNLVSHSHCLFALLSPLVVGQEHVSSSESQYFFIYLNFC